MIQHLPRQTLGGFSGHCKRCGDAPLAEEGFPGTMLQAGD
jgi:hypothetical protein